MHEINRVREEICRTGQSLFERGLTSGSTGNISVRLADGGWLMTPTNASMGSLDPAKLSCSPPFVWWLGFVRKLQSVLKPAAFKEPFTSRP